MQLLSKCSFFSFSGGRIQPVAEISHIQKWILILYDQNTHLNIQEPKIKGILIAISYLLILAEKTKEERLFFFTKVCQNLK